MREFLPLSVTVSCMSTRSIERTMNFNNNNKISHWESLNRATQTCTYVNLNIHLNCVRSGQNIDFFIKMFIRFILYLYSLGQEFLLVIIADLYCQQQSSIKAASKRWKKNEINEEEKLKHNNVWDK